MTASRARSARRRRCGAAIAAVWLILGPLAALADAAPRFRPVEVWLDSGSEPLAAYQVEVTAGSDTTIVGVEGGSGAAFAAPPHYDPAALRGGRIILADFSTSTDLPRGRTRVAVLHMREAPGSEPSYRANVIAAAGPDGRRISVTVDIVPQPGDPS